MEAIRNFGEPVLRAVATRLFYASKYVYQTLSALRSEAPKRILFIFGCQRSGTTLMQQIFDRDFNAKVYGEFSAITRTRPGSRNVRLRALEEVRAIFDRDHARLIVAKPIAETQNARRILAHFPGAKAVFIYRHYAAVASSNLKLFGQMNGIKNLRAIVRGDVQNWRADGVSEEVRAMVAARFDEGMNPYNAAALFWYVRNRFFFDLGLDRLPSVMLLRYEDLARDPSGAIERVYRFIGAPCSPAGAMLVRADSAGRDTGLRLSPDIEALCRDLLARLDRAHDHPGAAVIAAS
jgi:hypothetical protein